MEEKMIFDKVLNYLLHHDSPVSEIDMSEELNISYPTILKIVKKLEADGVLIRRR